MKISVSIFLLLIFSITAKAQNPSWQWARSAGGIHPDVGLSLHTDINGYIYVTGYFTSPALILGKHTLKNFDTTGHASQMFIAKYDLQGNVIWSACSQGTRAGAYPDVYNLGSGVSTDASSNVYIVGSYQSDTINFGSVALTYQVPHVNDIYYDVGYIVKYDSSGNEVWAKSMGGISNYLYKIFTNASDNNYVIGASNDSSLVLGIDTLKSNPESVFIVKFDPAGSAIWAKNSDSGFASGTDICADVNDNIYTTGRFSRVLIWGEDTLTSDAEFYEDVFAAKFNSSGTIIWDACAITPPPGSYINAEACSIAINGNDNIYITGNFDTNGDIIFGPDTIVANGAIDNGLIMYVVKYDSSGNIIWAKSAAGGISKGICTDISGNIYITGYFSGEYAVFGNDTLLNADTTGKSENIFVVKYNPSGNVIWAVPGQVPNNDTGYNNMGLAITADADDNLYITGSYESPMMILGNDTLTNVGDSISPGSFFIAKLGQTTTGISNIHTTPNSITVYPNPSSGQFYFKGINSGSAIEIYDVLGQTIYSSTVSGDTYLLDIAGQTEGIYFYRVAGSGASVQEGKIVLE